MLSFLEEMQNREKGQIFCWLFNIGIEKEWYTDRFRVKNPEEDRVVNHMEEILLLLSRKQDILLLRREPDARFLKEWQELGFAIPEIICPDKEDETKTITQLILEDEEALKALKGRAYRENICLIPYGVTDSEVELAKLCCMEMIGSTPVVTKRTNSKLYAKQLVERLSLASPVGKICVGFDEIQKEWYCLHKRFGRIVLKRPYGASGQGLYLIENETQLDRVLHVLKRSGGENEKWIVEGWYEDKTDLNTQIYICDDGRIEMLSIKEQILEDTVYKGSAFPADLPGDRVNQYAGYMKAVGNKLYREGVRGIVGIDSIMTDREMFPVIEINVRFTLSTYLSMMPVQFLNRYFCSMYYRVTLSDDWSYTVLTEKLKRVGLAFDKDRKEGIFCYNHACIDRNIVGKTGRLFVIFVAKQREGLWNLRFELERLLKEAKE